MPNNHFLQIIDSVSVTKSKSQKSQQKSQYAALCAQLSQTQQECLATVLSLGDTAQVLAWQKQPNSPENGNSPAGSEALAALSPCELVNQWGERKKMLLLLPIFQNSNSAQCQLMEQFIRFHLPNIPEILGLLTLSHKRPDILKERIGTPNFVEGWKFVLTVSFPIEEEAVWLLPLNQDELTRHGGEVDLPQALAKVWNCANTG